MERLKKSLEIAERLGNPKLEMELINLANTINLIENASIESDIEYHVKNILEQIAEEKRSSFDQGLDAGLEER